MKLYKEQFDIRRLVSETDTFKGATRMVQFFNHIHKGYDWILVDEDEFEFEYKNGVWKKLF